MIRRLLAILSLFSLLLCIAAGGLWVHGQWIGVVNYGSRASYQDDHTTWTKASLALAADSLQLVVRRSRFSGRFDDTAVGFVGCKWTPEKSLFWPFTRSLPSWLGFRYQFSASGDAPWRAFRLLIALPYWFIMLSTAALPILWTTRAWRSRRCRYRLRHGHCPTCGYDLRASKDRCPECGTCIPPPSTCIRK